MTAASTTANGYGAAAPMYRAAGWLGPLPIVRGTKWPPPPGCTGHHDDPTDNDIANWCTTRADDNVALRAPVGIVGIDVDAYDGKPGADTITAITAATSGPLPPTWTSTSRLDDHVSGIRWYRLPDGVAEPDHDPGPGVELIRHGHRYGLVEPSVHPEGRQYRWRKPDGTTADPGTVPSPSDLSVLSREWVDVITAGSVAPGGAPDTEPTGTATEPPRAPDPVYDTIPRGGWFAPTVADYNARNTWDDVLADKWKPTPKYDHDGIRYWHFKGQANEYGATTNATGNDTLIVHSGTATAAGWPASPSSLDRFGAHVMIATGRHDDRDARARVAAELRDVGYGTSTAGTVLPIGDTTADDSDDDDPLASWDPVDLGPALNGDKPKLEPTVLTRTDGRAVFYRARINLLHGDSGSGKTWVALAAAKQELLAGHAVIWLDFEDGDEGTVIERLIGMAVPADVIRRLLYYINPDTAADASAVAKVVALAREHHVTLVVVDSIGEAFALEGINEDKDAEVAPWFRRVLRVIADAGPAVVAIDHGTKSADNKLYPSGSKRKRAAVSGGGYLIEDAQPFSRDTPGWIHITCAKDRHGNYPKGSRVANVRVEPEPDGGIAISIHPPAPPRTAEQKNATAIVSAVRSAVTVLRKHPDGLSQTELQAKMSKGRSAATNRAGIAAGIRVGIIKATPGGPRNTITHTLETELDDIHLAKIRGEP